MVTTKSYDFLNRLTAISSTPSGASPVSFGYTYNNANQRVRSALADGSSWQYSYDPLGQVVSGHKFFADETPVAGQQFDYSFDNIGNRTQTLAGGDSAGLNQRLATYGANNLNQYTNRTVPGFVDVMGLALATNTVTVGGQTAYRKGEYFRNQFPVSNSSGAIWTNISISSPNQTSISGNSFVPQTPEYYTNDADGNLTADGRWAYAWDAENRLVTLQGQSAIPTGAKYKVDFAYDSQSRRIQKLVSTNNGSAYFPQSTNRFIYDGWNLLANLNSQASVVRSFVWGQDLSGSQQGAGGVGGLLALNDSVNGIMFAGYDGNGNVAAFAKGADGSIAAQYEYGPFGELLRATGPMAKANPFRFSTKYQDDETDLLYYGYRYYSPSAGRWASRDPHYEKTVGPIYSFVGNNPITTIDKDGCLAWVWDGGELLPCGGWHAFWQLDLSGMVGAHWLVSHITITRYFTPCPTQRPTHGPDEWWEALRVVPGGNYTDRDSMPSHARTFGTQSAQAESALFPDDSHYNSLIESWGHQVEEARDMFATRINPHIFDPALNTIARQTWSRWSCCCDQRNTWGHSSQ